MRTGLRSMGLLLAALALCPLAALLIGENPEGAVSRARDLAAVERALGLHVEPAVHAWALGHPGMMTAAGLFYVVAHIGVAGWALVWTWYLRRDAFAHLRDVFLLTQALLVVLYVLVPTAPPRLTPGSGFADTLSATWGHEAARSVQGLQSPYAAMPSGHVAFALVAGGAFALLGDRRWLRAFGWSYPPLVVAVTVVTGHHLWLDAVGAAIVVAAAQITARRRRSPPATTPAPRRRSRARAAAGPGAGVAPAGPS